MLSQDPVIRVMIDDSVETDYESLMKEEKERERGTAGRQFNIKKFSSKVHSSFGSGHFSSKNSSQNYSY